MDLSYLETKQLEKSAHCIHFDISPLRPLQENVTQLESMSYQSWLPGAQNASDLTLRISEDFQEGDTEQKVSDFIEGTPLGADLAAETKPLLYFLFQEGEGALKKSFTSHSLLTLNFYTLERPISPEKIAAAAIFYEPDIFLAQEVACGSSKALFDALKSRYPYFWTEINTEPNKKETSLFIASKYPFISKPTFIPFLGTKKRMEQGFFALETPTHWIVTLRLETHNKEKGLTYLAKHMSKTAKGKPYLLVENPIAAKTDDEIEQFEGTIPIHQKMHLEFLSEGFSESATKTQGYLARYEID